MNRQKIYQVLILILLALLGFSIWLGRNAAIDRDEQKELNLAMSDTLHQYKDKDSLNHGRIALLETQNVNTFLDLYTKDKEIAKLQASVEANKKYLKEQGSVTNFTSETNIKTSTPTTVVETSDPGSPIYKSPFNLRNKGITWVSGSVVASRDSTLVDLKVRNEYSLVIGEEPTGFLGLGKPKPFADVKNLNPWSETTDLRSYQVNLPKPKKVHIGLGVFYGFGAEFKPQPLIGGGILYDFINF